MRATVEQSNAEHHMYEVKVRLNRQQKSKWVPASDVTGSSLVLKKKKEQHIEAAVTFRFCHPF